MPANKLKLIANPTFKAKVGIPVAGGDPAEVMFEFKHRTRDELAAFLRALDEMTDVQMALAVATGWDLTDAFNEKNVALLMQNYIGSTRAVLDVYVTELAQARLGN